MARGDRFRSNGPIVSGGQIVENPSLVEEEYAVAQMKTANGRPDLILQRNNKKTGTLNEKTLNYQQSRKLEAFIHALEKSGYDIGDYMDWLAMQFTIRPTAGQSLVSITNYTLQSIFIDVSARGRQDGLFNQLVAEGIQILYEFTVECVADPIMQGSPEECVRQGFDSIAKGHKKGLNKELFDAMDDHLDALETAIEGAINKGKPELFKGMTSSASHAYYQAGRHIVKESLKLPDGKPGDGENKDPRYWTKQKLIENPTAAFDYYNMKFKHVGLHLESDWVEKIHDERDAVHSGRKENDTLKSEFEALKTAVIKNDEVTLKKIRDAAAHNHSKPLSV